MTRKPPGRISWLPRRAARVLRLDPSVDRWRRIINNALGSRPDDDLETEQERKTNNPSELFIVFITILIRPGHVRRAGGCRFGARSETTALRGPFFYTTKARRSRPTAKIYLWRSSCSKNDTAARFDGRTISRLRGPPGRDRNEIISSRDTTRTNLNAIIYFAVGVFRQPLSSKHWFHGRFQYLRNYWIKKLPKTF